VTADDTEIISKASKRPRQVAERDVAKIIGD